MNNKNDKRVNVVTKLIKQKDKKEKQHLEINIPNDPETLVKKNSINGFPNSQQIAPNFKSSSTLTSPTNFKSIPLQNQFIETDPKKNNKQPMIQKRVSNKQMGIKIQNQPKPLNVNFGSPKANIQKQKILISYTSEKNLFQAKPEPKKQTLKDHNDAISTKLAELQKIIEESTVKMHEHNTRQQQYLKQIGFLKHENEDLKKKMQKIKQSNEQTKKMLKQRISSFNEEGEELKSLRTQIKNLQLRIESLVEQNNALKAELNKYGDLINRQDGEERKMTEINAISGSRIGQSFFKQSQDKSYMEFDNLQNFEEKLELQSYISQADESCIQEYKNNIEIFDRIKQEYEEIIKDIETRYKLLVEDYKNLNLQQAQEIYELQKKNDELYDQLQNIQNKNELNPKSLLSLEFDEIILQNFKTVADCQAKIYDIKLQVKDYIEEIEKYKSIARFLQAELDIERLKKKMKNQNDKFEFNVVKMNLLNIIDKFKIQVDKEKYKYNQLLEKLTPSESRQLPIEER